MARGKPRTFEEFAATLVLDNGDRLVLEEFQRAFVADVDSGIPECWLVIPEGNGKTTLLSAFVLWHLIRTPFASVNVAATTRQQAMILYRQAKGFVMRSGLGSRFKCLDGYRRIQGLEQQESMAQIFGADAGAGDGAIPTLGIIDEPHRAKSMDLYLTWSGKLNKRAGQLVAISTAGEPGSEFEQIRERIRQTADEAMVDGCFGRYRSELVVLHEWAVPEGGDTEDLALVKAANPLPAITVDTLRQKHDKPTMTPNHWRRFTCNQPTRSDYAAITEAVWRDARAEGEVPEGVPVWLGFDPGFVYDPTALVPFSPADGQFLPATILEPPADRSGLPVYMVQEAIVRINERNPVETIVVDTLQQDRGVSDWAVGELGCNVLERGTGRNGQVEDYERFMAGLREGRIHHSGDEGLTRHALNAIARPLPGGDYVFERPLSSRSAKFQDQRRIDALIAAAIVYSAATAGSVGSVYDDRGVIAI